MKVNRAQGDGSVDKAEDCRANARAGDQIPKTWIGMVAWVIPALGRLAKASWLARPCGISRAPSSVSDPH